MKYNLITILGPTAVGKTKLAVELAHKFNGEIISADSRQVYIGMDIGTGKDLSEYEIEGQVVPHHIIDVTDPTEEFNLYRFTRLFYKSFDEVINKNKLPFLVGGTGLYLHSILSEYELTKVEFNSERAEELKNLSEEELRKILQKVNPVLHNTTDLLERDRIIKAILIAETEHKDQSKPEKINSFNIGIYLPREEIKKRITHRLKERLETGMIEEVQELLARGIPHSKLHFFGLEYKYISLYLQNEINYNDMFQKLNSAIHNFAKRQMTWFRKMEREGIEINWIDGPDIKKAEQMIKNNVL